MKIAVFSIFYVENIREYRFFVPVINWFHYKIFFENDTNCQKLQLKAYLDVVLYISRRVY